MGFRCGFCGKAQPAKTKSEKIPTKIRERNYPPVQKRDKSIVGSWGWEIVEERLACPACVTASRKPEIIGPRKERVSEEAEKLTIEPIDLIEPGKEISKIDRRYWGDVL